MEMHFIASANKWGCWIDPDCLLTVEDRVYNTSQITDALFWFTQLGRDGVIIDEYTDLGDDALKVPETVLVDENFTLDADGVYRATIVPGLRLEIAEHVFSNLDLIPGGELSVEAWLIEIGRGELRTPEEYRFVRV